MTNYLPIIETCASVATAILALYGYLLVRKQWRSDSLHREHMELRDAEIRNALRIIFAADPREFLVREDLRLRDAAEKVLDMYDLIGHRARAGTLPKDKTIATEWPTILRVSQKLWLFIEMEKKLRGTDYKKGFKWLVEEIARDGNVKQTLEDLETKQPEEREVLKELKERYKNSEQSKTHPWTELTEVRIDALPGFRNSRPCVAVGIICNQKVLLLQRALSPQEGRWELPGGFLDDGEDARAGARREVLEETRFAIVSLDLFSTYVGDYDDGKYNTINLCFRAELGPGILETAFELSKESTAATWHPLNTELPPLAFPWIQDFVDLLRKYENADQTWRAL